MPIRINLPFVFRIFKQRFSKSDPICLARLRTAFPSISITLSAELIKFLLFIIDF